MDRECVIMYLCSKQCEKQLLLKAMSHCFSFQYPMRQNGRGLEFLLPKQCSCVSNSQTAGPQVGYIQLFPGKESYS